MRRDSRAECGAGQDFGGLAALTPYPGSGGSGRLGAKNFHVMSTFTAAGDSLSRLAGSEHMDFEILHPVEKG